MSKLPVFLILLCFFSTTALAQTADDNCDPYPDVPVTVTPVMDDATYDYATSIGNLRALEETTPHFYEKLLLGVTSYKPVIVVNTNTRSINLQNGLTCVKITSAEIKIGYQNIVMHIASEIPQGTCGFNEVVAHEQKHVTANQQTFQAYYPLIQQKLQEYLKLNGLIQVPNYGYAMTVLHDNMKDIIKQIVEEMQQQEIPQQQQIDSQQEFMQMAQSCNGQLGQIARQYRLTGQ